MGGPSGGSRKKGKKNRKHGRNKAWCQAYRARGQREKNKKKRQERLLRQNKGSGRIAQASFFVLILRIRLWGHRDVALGASGANLCCVPGNLRDLHEYKDTIL